MAITTDTGAKKISGSDNWREIFDDHNDTVDAYDKNITDLHNDIGIVVNGNKTSFPTGAAVGGFVILKNSTISDGNGGTLDDGLYTAAKAIPYDSAIDNTYLTAVSGGGLNALNSKMTLKTLFEGNVTVSNGIGKIPASSMLYTHWYPLYCSTVQDNIVVACSPRTDSSGVVVYLATSPGYSGPWSIQLLGFGWN